ncbi:uncharacterized protein BS16045_01463 [Bacillus subtilis]|nr:uncharacterized protein BS16045_01463 [Bacillus subtilis]
MKELAILITEMVNQFHDAFISLCGIFGIHLTDKEMHFWHILFRRHSRCVYMAF